MEYEKQAAFWGCYGVGGGKCGMFLCPCVGAYCIRPTNVPFMGRMIQMIDHQCAFLPPAGPFGGAYAIRPYHVTRKMITVGVCFEVEYEKQAAFWGGYGVGGGNRGAFDCFTVVVCPNRGAFLCPCVGAYCIRPTNAPFMGRMVQMIDRRCAFLSPAGPFDGAYAIRPYPDGRKMITFGACFEVEYEKQAAFWGCYGVGGGKCGAFDCFTVVVCINRGAFLCRCVEAYCICPTGVPFMGRMIQMIDRRCAFLSPAGPLGGAYTIRPYRVTRKMIVFGVCFAVGYEK